MKGTKLYSILFNRCPRCHEGKFWPAGPIGNLLTHKGGMYETCSHCGLKYTREIGFWYGAMYVSYAVGVAIFVALWVATSVLGPDLSVFAQMGIVIAGIIALAPFNYWSSRLMWINFFVKYSGDELKETEINSEPQIVS